MRIGSLDNKDIILFRNRRTHITGLAHHRAACVKVFEMRRRFVIKYEVNMLCIPKISTIVHMMPNLNFISICLSEYGKLVDISGGIKALSMNIDRFTFKCISLLLDPHQVAPGLRPHALVHRGRTSLLALEDCSESVSCVAPLCKQVKHY